MKGTKDKTSDKNRLSGKKEVKEHKPLKNSAIFIGDIISPIDVEWDALR